MGSGSLPSNNNLNNLNDFRPGNALKSVRNLSRFNVPGKYSLLYFFSYNVENN